MKKYIKFMFISFLAVLVIVIALFAEQIAPYDPLEASLREAFQAPCKKHFFGTDALGRDVFSRVICGTRTSVFSVLLLVSIVLAVGTLLGIAAGYFGGVVDGVIMRIGDMMIAFPDLILAIAIAGILGPSLRNSMIAITAVSWTRYARLSRSLVLKIRTKTYISAAEISGTRNIDIVRKYIFPNIIPTMITTAATDIGSMMLALASLSFLGFGIQPPAPEWGYMLSEGRTYILSSPWLLFCPGIAVFVTVVVFNLWGDCLRDMITPNKEKNKRRKRKQR